MTKNFESPFELKFLAETGVFEGYASVFHVTDSVNDRIVPGAFRESLAQFSEEGRLPPLLWQHDTATPIGAWREMYEDAHGLFVRGELFVSDLPSAKEAYKLLKEKVVTGLSIGYRAKKSYRDTKSGARVLTAVDLHEVSLVTFPANEHARVSRFPTQAHDAMPSARHIETVLRAAGLSRSQAKSVLARGYKALVREDGNVAIDDGDARAMADLAARMFAAAADVRRRV